VTKEFDTYPNWDDDEDGGKVTLRQSPVPRRRDAYVCDRCHGTFYRSNVMCLVAHPHGTCCHYKEERVG
jgi:hypothetical protein